MHVDKFHSMQVSAEIAERGSLTAAAEASGRSLPTMVRILASLEQALQIRPFNRTMRRVALTEESRLYLDQCRRILSDVRETGRALAKHQAEPGATIRPTARMRFGEMRVAPAVVSFLKPYPATGVERRFFDRVVDLLEEGIDVAVRIAHLASKGFQTRVSSFERGDLSGWSTSGARFAAGTCRCRFRQTARRLR